MSKATQVRKRVTLADAVASSAIEEAEINPTAEEVVQPQATDTEYPPASDLTTLYAAGLLPSSNVPAAHTPQAVAVENRLGKPVAVLVTSNGEVLPVPIPYIASPSATPLYSEEEAEKYRAIYAESESIRVQQMLTKNTKETYDPKATPEVDEDQDEDLYGEPMSQAVAAAFPNASKK